MTLLVYNTLTTLILFDQLDPKTFEVSQKQVEEDDDESEDVEDILAQSGSTSIVFTDKRRNNKKIEKGEILAAKVTKMMITQGNVVLYAILA